VPDAGKASNGALKLSTSTYNHDVQKSSSFNPSVSMPKKQDPNIVQIINILAAEIGLEKSDLGPDVAFADISVDSLLSLQIVGRLKKVLAASMLVSLVGVVKW
jgi:hypothetical protein